MLEIDKVKELLGNSSIPDEEAIEIRDACQAFAELALKYLQSIKNTDKKLDKLQDVTYD